MGDADITFVGCGTGRIGVKTFHMTEYHFSERRMIEGRARVGLHLITGLEQLFGQ